MIHTHEGSKIEELSTGELSRLEAGRVYQAEFLRVCAQPVKNIKGKVIEVKTWSSFLVEYEKYWRTA